MGAPIKKPDFVITKLEELARLKEEGIIDYDAFEKAKKQLLSDPSKPGNISSPKKVSNNEHKVTLPNKQALQDKPESTAPLPNTETQIRKLYIGAEIIFFLVVVIIIGYLFKDSLPSTPATNNIVVGKCYIPNNVPDGLLVKIIAISADKYHFIRYMSDNDFTGNRTYNSIDGFAGTIHLNGLIEVPCGRR